MYSKSKCNEIETKSSSMIIRGINGLQRVAKSKNVLHDKNSNLLPGCHSIFHRRMKYFSLLLKAHVFSEVRQTKIHTDK